jgi:hypothetical protein
MSLCFRVCGGHVVEFEQSCHGVDSTAFKAFSISRVADFVRILQNQSLVYSAVSQA